nr:type II toxin-antitoxin system HicB family antitoxin [Desulfitobacterium chlororespirans]
MMITYYAFPALMECNALSGRYIVVFPDLPDLICQGETRESAFHDAEISLGLHLYHMEKDKIHIPHASNPASWTKGEGAEVIELEADTLKVRQVIDKKRVPKCIMIPKWLKDLGEEHEVNFVQILMEGLMEELGIPD